MTLTKTPEEMAEEFGDMSLPHCCTECSKQAFLAGVKAVLKEAKKISKEVWRNGDIISIVELDELEGLFELGKQEQS